MECNIDPNRMKQVFWNLATNSLKAMPSGGELSIEVGLRPAEGQIEISFTDEGQGIDERQQERYFQPFSGSFREGTGLGAAIVYRLIQEHRGKIRLVSSREAGTSVRILLPHTSVPERAEPRDLPVPLAAAGGWPR